MKTLDQLKAETDRLKSEINLVDFAAYYDRFNVDNKRNSNSQIENMNCVLLRNDVDDKIIISRNTNGHYIYFNPENNRDNGTVFDFIENRRSGKNYSMSYAKKILNDFAGNITKEYIKPLGINLKPTSNKSSLQKVQDYFRQLPTLKDTSFLESRGLSPELLQSNICKKRIYNEEYKGKEGATYMNTVFPVYGFDDDNKSVVLGFERRNEQFKGSFEGSVKNAAIWVSAFDQTKPLNDFVISESPIDSLSYAQLKHDWRFANHVYCATSGSAWNGHIDIFQKTINNFQPQSVVLANDNDCAGERFNAKTLAKLDLSRYVEEEYLNNNKMLVHADIDVSLKDKYTGQIEWKLSHDKVFYNEDDKIKNLEQHIPCFKSIQDYYEGKNKEFLEVNRDKTIFVLEKVFKENQSVIKVNFPNNHENWKLITESIYQLKVDFSEHIKIDRAISKDWNQDLQDYLKNEKKMDINENENLKEGKNIYLKL